jgi:small subunit ribosomal protein S7
MRGKQARKRKLLPDAIYNSLLVAKFINNTMKDGKKHVAQGVVYKALEKLGEETKMKPIDALLKAINNIKPKMEVRSRRVGGANYQVPVAVSPERQEALAMRWLIRASSENRKTTDSATALARELLSATKKEGFAFKKMEDTHKMADANKAFAHFQW